MASQGRANTRPETLGASGTATDMIGNTGADLIHSPFGAFQRRTDACPLLWRISAGVASCPRGMSSKRPPVWRATASFQRREKIVPDFSRLPVGNALAD